MVPGGNRSELLSSVFATHTTTFERICPQQCIGNRCPDLFAMFSRSMGIWNNIPFQIYMASHTNNRYISEKGGDIIRSILLKLSRDSCIQIKRFYGMH